MYDILVNKVKYIPVAVATLGSIPIITSIGQNIIPPPMPQNAEINAPNHAMKTKMETLNGLSLRSPGTNL